jgi:hypothetical protein
MLRFVDTFVPNFMNRSRQYPRVCFSKRNVFCMYYFFVRRAVVKVTWAPLCLIFETGKKKKKKKKVIFLELFVKD